MNQFPKSLGVAARAAWAQVVSSDSLRMMFLILESLIWNFFKRT